MIGHHQTANLQLLVQSLAVLFAAIAGVVAASSAIAQDGTRLLSTANMLPTLTLGSLNATQVPGVGSFLLKQERVCAKAVAERPPLHRCQMVRLAVPPSLRAGSRSPAKHAMLRLADRSSLAAFSALQSRRLEPDVAPLLGHQQWARGTPFWSIFAEVQSLLI